MLCLPEKLERYNRDTLQMYLDKYKWYNMPQAVHKMLVHSHDVIAIKCVPVGCLSKEPKESSNKISNPAENTLPGRHPESIPTWT